MSVSTQINSRTGQEVVLLAVFLSEKIRVTKLPTAATALTTVLLATRLLLPLDLGRLDAIVSANRLYMIESDGT